MATMRSPSMATDWAIVPRASAVKTLPFVSTSVTLRLPWAPEGVALKSSERMTSEIESVRRIFGVVANGIGEREKLYHRFQESSRKGAKSNDERGMRNDELKTSVFNSSFITPHSALLFKSL